MSILRSLRHYLSTNKWLVLFLLLALLAMQHFVIKPSKVYVACDREAQKFAIDLYKSKNDYKGEKERYIREDYDHYYAKCLRRNGLDV